MTSTSGHNNSENSLHVSDPSPGNAPLAPKDKGVSSINDKEVEKFNGVEWWNEISGPMKPLISMNKLRVPFIRDGILESLQLQASRGKTFGNDTTLDGFRILDIGCGGGILSEGLGQVGALVVGIDPGKENISIARGHLPVEMKDRITYECTTIEEYASKYPDRNFDAVVMSEVIEHVENPEAFIITATKLLKPNGSLFITAPNRTLASWFSHILMGEYLLRIISVGTHSWKKFLTPNEVQHILEKEGLRVVKLRGMTYNPVRNIWSWTSVTQLQYALHAIM